MCYNVRMKEKPIRTIPAVENDLVIYESKQHNLVKGDCIYIPQNIDFKGALWEVLSIVGGTVHFVPNNITRISPKMTFKELIKRKATIEICKKSETGNVFAAHSLDNKELMNSIGIFNV